MPRAPRAPGPSHPTKSRLPGVPHPPNRRHPENQPLITMGPWGTLKPHPSHRWSFVPSSAGSSLEFQPQTVKGALRCVYQRKKVTIGEFRPSAWKCPSRACLPGRDPQSLLTQLKHHLCEVRPRVPLHTVLGSFSMMQA